MKKTLIFLLVVVISVSSLCVAAGYELNFQGKNVEYTLVTEEGDRSFLEGVSADISYSHNERLLWNVHFVPFKETETKVSFNKFGNTYDDGWIYYGITADSCDLFELKNQSETLNTDFTNAMKTAESTGNPTALEIRLSDYFDYYPMFLDVSLPDIQISYMSAPVLGEKGEYYFDGISKERGEGFIKALSEYMTVPVSDDDMRNTVIEKTEAGNVYSSRYSNTYYMNFFNAVFPDKLYFTVNNRTEVSENVASALLDTSLIPGGYGIYCVPYEKGDIKYENISTVYSLPSESTVLQFWGDEVREELYIVLREDGQVFFKVIDQKTMREISSLRLYGYSDADWLNFRSYDDFILFFKNGNEMKLAKRVGDGVYEESLSYTSEENDTVQLEYFSYDAQWDFDGERLVMLHTDNYPDFSADEYTLQLEMAVFTDGKTEYYGKWNCSLGDKMYNRIHYFAWADEYEVSINEIL